MTPESRLIEIRKTIQLNQTDFAASMGFSRSVIADIERSQTKVTIKILEAVMKKYSANVTWLLTGDGEMFLSSETKEVDKPSLGYLEDVFATKIELQESIDRLGESSANAASSIVSELREELADAQERIESLRSIVYREHSIAEPEEIEVNALEEDMLDKNECEVRGIEIPYLGLAAAAGPLRELDTVDETILVPENLLPVKLGGIFVGRIEGDSMSDIIPDGSNMLLRVCKEPMSGHVYVFTLRGKATIKKFRIDHTGPHFEYMDGSGRSIYPEAGEQWYCNAEFLRVL